MSYLAQSGTLTISALGPNFAGTLTGATFVEIDDSNEPVPGGCTVSLASVAFDTTIQNISAKQATTLTHGKGAKSHRRAATR